MTADATGLDVRSRLLGCLLGGAVGDSLGAAIEFMSLEQIRRVHGPEGVTGLTPAYGRLGAITDDTQMTLFTAEGLIRAANRFGDRGIVDVPGVVHHAYLRWLRTQGEHSPAEELYPHADDDRDGWLITNRGLFARRAPGTTCLHALMAHEPGRLGRPINDSKGCGGVMRAAPAAAMRDPFRTGCEVAAITHGHPSGYLAAGYLAALIARLLHGDPLGAAVEATTRELTIWPHHEEVLSAIEHALALAGEGDPGPVRIERLGAGWVAEEALAIALFCALVADGFPDGVLLAVNHSGDSDSTGAIAGSILGAIHGPNAIPPEWLAELELRDVLETVAADLYTHVVEMTQITSLPGTIEMEVARDSWIRYPGW